MPPLITLTTDFGERDPYVAAMKGVIYGICPHARVVDLTHQIPSQDVFAGALFLQSVLPCWPDGSIHIAVVDPGVGTSRRALAVYVANKIVVCPDNGLVSSLWKPGVVAQAIENPRIMRKSVSATFHGRDVFAPAAAWLANDIPFDDIGPIVEDVVLLDLPRMAREGDNLVGAVVHIDRFGNLVTNIPAEALADDVVKSVRIAGVTIDRISRTYADAPEGEPLALIGSGGFLEIAVNCGSAKERLAIGRGERIVVAL